MNSRKKMTGVLAGVSLTALAIGIGQAQAAGTIIPTNVAPVGTYVQSVPTDFLHIDSYDINGDVINNSVIGDGLIENGYAILVDGTSSISGQLINNATATTNVTVTSNTATASAVGIEIDDPAVVPEIVNNGLVHAGAYAYGNSEAYAQAFGIEYDAAYENAIASVLNTEDGIVEATALASATGTSASLAIASADAVGIDQWVNAGGGSGQALVENDGIVSADAQAIAGTFTDYAFGESAFAEAAGIQQDVFAKGNGVASVINNSTGSISASASAFAQGSTYTSVAEALAAGVVQVVDVGGNGLAEVVNDGSISAGAVAYASSFRDAPAIAEAVGVEQDVFGSQSGAAYVSNGPGAAISATATATAFAQDNWTLDAEARAAGVSQHAASIDRATAVVENSGGILATANAFATGRTYGEASTAFADAAAIGVEQRASSNGNATASLTNTSTGEIEASANAFASGGGSAYVYQFNIQATATATGVDQSATADFEARAGITNNGTIKATSFADASATYGGAEAEAKAIGAAQYVNTVFGNATASLTNTASNSIDAYANAAAYAATTAEAEAIARGVDQYVYSDFGNVLVETINTGAIFATAVAYASGTYSGDAVIFGEATGTASGVEQSGSSSTGSVTVGLTSGVSDVIGAQASATALAASEATAEAYAFGVDQYGSSGAFTDLSVVNDGAIRAFGDAYATATYGRANAYGGATGVEQYASGSTGAQALVANGSTGSIDAALTAEASGSDYASARGYAYGVDQYVSGPTALAVVENDGSISALVDVYASASSSAGDAYAYGYNVYGVNQSVNGNDATAIVTNTSPDSIDASVLADAYGGDNANAYGYNVYGVNQSVGGSNSALAVVENDGSISALVDVYASASSSAGDASVYGYNVYGVNQSVSANTASAYLTNTSPDSIDAAVIADAYGGDNANAYGYNVYGVNQSVSGSNSALAVVENDGSISALVDVYASASSSYGDANTYGYNVYGVNQSVSGSTASAYLTNTSPDSIDAAVIADAYGGDYANAYGFNVYGVNQSVGGSNSALAVVENDGSISALVDVYASASATYGDANAYGYNVYGVNQSVSANNASAYLTNTSPDSIDAAVIADAYGGDYANAYGFNVYGVNQSVGGSNSALAVADNDGSISALVDVYASASATYGDANAYGYNVYGVNHSVSANNASAYLTNTSPDSIDAAVIADAYGGDYANVYGFNVYGVNQSVGGSNSALAVADNDGSISALVDVYASASATYGDANAYGNNVYGVNQSVGGSTAVASVTNTSPDSIDAVVIADAYGGDYANAYGNNVYGVNQSVAGTTAQALVDNDGSISALVDVYASASATYGDANAYGYNVYGVNQSVAGSTAVASVTNTSPDSIAAAVIADAYGGDYANAYGNDVYGVNQSVAGTTAQALVENDGSISALVDVYASASATYGDANAYGYNVYGVNQSVAGSTAVASVTNTSPDSIAAAVIADAYGGDNANAYGNDVYGVNQSVAGSTAQALVDNDGSISALVDVYASASTSYGAANAYGTNVFGIRQSVSGTTASAGLANTSSGDISVDIDASAHALDVARATGSGIGVEQSVGGNSAIATVLNDGTIGVSVFALASGTQSFDASYASANASAAGVIQNVSGGTYALASVTNTSFLSIDVAATASAFGSTFAQASAIATGVNQVVNASGPALAETINSGSINVAANANATATSASGQAEATAQAFGVLQFVQGSTSTARLDNSGLISVSALAHADGFDDFASASALGYSAQTNGSLALDVTNNGAVQVVADATAWDEADAFAQGLQFRAATLNGSIDNGGDVVATALASAYSAEASAFGVVEITNGGGNNVALTNSGLVSAYAAANGSDAEAKATAIAIAASDGAGAVDDLATITNNGGAIWAGTSVNGEPIKRGNAINTQGFSTIFTDFGAAPNPVEINLLGNNPNSTGYITGQQYLSQLVQDSLATESGRYGYIFGNIEIGADDDINVADGYTLFDGVINPNGEYEGELTIAEDGILALLQNPVDGPAGAFVENFNHYGTVVYELTPDTTPGSYPQINAINAYVEGNAVALYQGGIYADEFRYEGVVEADDLESIAGTGFFEVEDNSALLVTRGEVVGERIDLVVERQAFDEAVSGMTKNQTSVAEAIENTYDDIYDGTENYQTLIGSLFSLNEEDYPEFLNQLTGAEFAQHLQSVLWSTRAINRIVTERMECSGSTTGYTQTSGLKGSLGDGNAAVPVADAPMAATGCFEPERVSVWMRGFGSWNDLDGDQEAPGFEEDQYGILFGADYSFNEDWFAGLAGGYFDSNGDFDNWGGGRGASIDYDGFQIAAYGGYDNSVYYARGVLAYGNYDGESHRYIQYPGGSPIDPSGDPSSDVLSFYGETGYRFEVGTETFITPYLGLSLAKANLDSFTESDPEGTGAALQVHDADATSIASVLGLRFDSEMAMGSGMFVPSISLAWSHEFDDRYQSVDMSFADGPAGADFTVIGSEVSRDSLLVDVGAKYVVDDSIEFGLYYNGWFSSDYTSNAITARLGYKF